MIVRGTDVTYSTPTGRRLQDGLHFDVRPGQLLMITGSNGCGKSTLLRAFFGEWSLDRGAIERGIGPRETEYIPQLDNTEVHLPLTLWDVLRMSHTGKLTVEEVTAFGLLREAQLTAAWNTASGGERKRTLLTRALLKRPRLLVLDEPMNHLDSASRRAMVRVMSEFLSDESQCRAILMVCHQGLENDECAGFDIVPLDLDASRLC